jgi:hypothetical protein
MSKRCDQSDKESDNTEVKRAVRLGRDIVEGWLCSNKDIKRSNNPQIGDW